ncbi:MAG TPA: terminase large subunit [Gemmatimonadota bacterium]|nr:terminase large subunit [Gemmatimonadota bacterium]
MEHFRVWALALELDNGEAWVVDDWFLVFAEDYFAGIPEVWGVVPEGNAKTTSVAGLMVYLLEHRRRAAIPWAASTREQAEIGYRQAEGFVLSSTRLRSVMKCQEGYRRIKNLVTGGRMQVFAADDAHADGIIPTDAFLDELHRHKNLRLYRTWRGKLLKRGGQMATITTAGEPGSEFEETRERIRQETPVVESRPGFTHCRSASIALHEYAVPEGGDVEDMQVVKLANPFSGITVEQLEAKRATPTMTPQHWSRFVCNLATRTDAAAIQEREWFGATDEDGVPDGAAVSLGIDFGWKWDTTSIVPLWWESDERRVFASAVILEPPRDSSSMHPDVVKRALVELFARFEVERVVLDISNAHDIAAWISDEFQVDVIDRAQTTAPKVEDYNRFMEGLRSGTLWHSGDPGLRRHALNAIARILPGGDMRFARVSDTRQGGNQDARVIDALDAAAMVHSYEVETRSMVPLEPMVAFA